jgi:type I pantothenate kinase
MAGGLTPSAAYADLARLAAAAAGDVAGRRPALVGIAGPVGVGKSTTAALVRRELAGLGLATEVVSTDGFLFPNEVLAARGLMMRKGFPESYDRDLLQSFLARVAAGEGGVEVPSYSHAVYDRVPGPGRRLEPADVLIVEGVNALQPPAVDRLDLAVYVDADEAALVAWFVERFLVLCREADADATGSSFYCRFAGLGEDERASVARSTWDHVNAVNLREHIAPSRARATHVLRKRADHGVSALVATAGPGGP